MTPGRRRATRCPRVGVIGTGAMGGGVVQSLVRAGIATSARDIRAEAQARAVAPRRRADCDSPAALARACDVVIVLVVDADQVETVLFGADGVDHGASARARRARVVDRRSRAT